MSEPAALAVDAALVMAAETGLDVCRREFVNKLDGLFDLESDWFFSILPTAIKAHGFQRTLFDAQADAKAESKIDKQLHLLLTNDCRYPDNVATVIIRLLQWPANKPRPRIALPALDILAKIPQPWLIPTLTGEKKFHDGPGDENRPCPFCGEKDHQRCLAYDELPLVNRGNAPSLMRFAEQLKVRYSENKAGDERESKRQGPIPPPKITPAAQVQADVQQHLPIVLPDDLTDWQFLDLVIQLKTRWQAGQQKTVVDAIADGHLGKDAALRVLHSYQGAALIAQALRPYAENIVEPTTQETSP